ncbi:MAG: efflux RND transporter permease subunit [Alphaproteobacteria bacterium]
MNALIGAALSHSRMVLSTLALLLVAGYATYVAIPKESDPDINIPIIYVSMSLEGVSPEDAERLLVKPIEQEVRSVEGLKEMRSTAYLGGANVVLEFEAGFDADQALLDVREDVDRAKPNLPAEADEPTVNEVNLSLFPVITVNLHGPVPERTLLAVARRLEDAIEALPPVLSVDIAGDREEQVEVIIDPVVAESYGLAVDELVTIVSNSNRLIAAGQLDTGNGRFAIRVPGLFENLNDILTLPIKVDGDRVIMLRDVATVQRTFKDPQSYARINGEPAVGLEVVKRSGENVIETIEMVKATVASLREFIPETVEITYSGDSSQDIRRMLDDLQNNIISAVLLVMIVIVGALGIKSGLLVGVAIPGSFLTGILVLAIMGLTVNIVVLFALILAVGMLVDGAIVVTEYADRKLAEGYTRKQAYGAAAKRMAWPIIASTATTLAAFLPLLFWPGIVGEFMQYLPITLIATLSASLAMALIFVPTLGGVLGRQRVKMDEAKVAQMKLLSGDDPSTDIEAALRSVKGFTGGYVRVLRGALRHPGKILIAAVLALVGAQMAYGTFGRGVEFFPSIEPEQISLQVKARGNLSVDEQDFLVAEVEDIVLDVAAERNEMASVYTRSGGQGQSQDAAEDVIGIIAIEFVEWDRRRSAREIEHEILERASELAGITVEVREQEAGPAAGKPVQIQIASQYPELIEPTVVMLRDRMERTPGLIDIEDSRPLPGVEWELTIDRAQAAKFDASIAQIGSLIRLVTNGLRFSEYRPDDADDEVDIVARYPVADRNLSMLDRIRIQTNAGLVPISNFVVRSAEPRVGTLARTGGVRVMTVKADIDPAAVDARGNPLLATDMINAMKDWLADAQIDPRVEVSFQGEDEDQAEAQAFLTSAFGIALFIMAIILVTQFNSFYSAFLILSAVIMSTVGVMLGLLLTNQPFGIVMSGVGVIALAGIVVNNNIVLIDTYDQLRKTVTNPMHAILLTGAQRLRPVMLTTVTTILGLMPMVLQVNIDFAARSLSVGAPSTQWWVQLSTAIAFGLTFATVLTLIVTPCALLARENVRGWRARRRERRDARRAAAGRTPAQQQDGWTAEPLPEAAE